MIQIPRLHLWIYLLLALPLLLIRVNNSHDWGDDFAQYLMQSKFLSGEISSLPVTATASHGPEVKGVLFSVLLIPATFLTDAYEIQAGKLIVSLTLILFGWALLLFFKSRIGDLPATALSLAMIYNFHLIRLKDQILPDFLLAALTVFSMILFLSKNRRLFYCGLILAGLSVGIKTAGMAIVITSGLLIVLGRNQLTRTKAEKLKAITVLFVPVLVVYLAEILMTSSKPSVYWYSFVTARQAGLSVLTDNFHAYVQGFYSYLEFEVPMAFNKIFRWVTVLLFLAGFGYRLIRKAGWPEVFMLIYSLFLLLYPYSKDPIRFLVPVMPLIVFFVVQALLGILTWIRLQKVLGLWVMLMVVLTAQTLRLEMKRTIGYDTETADSRELMTYLQTLSGTEKLVADTKPWAIAYFTHVRSVPFEAAYLSGYRILRLEGYHSFQGNRLSADSVVFENKSFRVIRQDND